MPEFASMSWNGMSEYLDMEPTGQTTLKPAVHKLKQAGLRLAVRLPRLVMAVHDLKVGADTDLPSVIRLAAELVKLREEDAENDLFHCVSVVETAHPPDAGIVPCSFNYPELGAQEAALFYWTGCIFLARLCAQLQRLDRQACSNFETSLYHLKTEAARMAKNILMSLQYTLATGSLGVGCLPIAFACVWGAIEDFDAIPHKPKRQVYEWIVQRSCDALGVQCASYEPLIAYFQGLSDQCIGGPVPPKLTEDGSDSAGTAWEGFIKMINEQNAVFGSL